MCVHPALGFAVGPRREGTTLAENPVTHMREILFPLIVSVCGGGERERAAERCV